MSEAKPVTKTFRAPTMMAALQEVQREMGPEALVVSLREIPGGPLWQVWRKPGYEVIATRPAEKPAPANGEGQGGGEAQPVAAKGAVDPVQLLLEIATHMPEKKAIEKEPPRVEEEEPVVAFDPHEMDMAASEARLGAARPGLRTAAPGDLPDLLIETRQDLLDQGLDESLVNRMINTYSQAFSPAVLADRKRLNAYLKRQLEAGLRGSHQTMVAPPGRVMCLVGASGSGKTSTCAKLASYYAHSVGKKVVWIGADTFRPAGIVEAQVYTDTIGIPFHLVYTPPELVEAIEAHPEADLILVDLPGCNPFDERMMVELGGFLTEVPRRSTYLLTPATFKESDLQQALASFGTFSLKGLIVTKMDETHNYGSIYNIAWRSQLPLAYMTNGIHVMGNLHPGDPALLTRALFDGGFEL
ncbi:MAG: hypothetical protein GYA17_05005 [Chloroflexi bacterium]|nr:hypothetical protein [Anaerolineaceae bacterium]NMB87693.1 hypothetical protein [Chloroflexota bacterium]